MVLLKIEQIAKSTSCSMRVLIISLVFSKDKPVSCFLFEDMFSYQIHFTTLDWNPVAVSLIRCCSIEFIFPVSCHSNQHWEGTSGASKSTNVFIVRVERSLLRRKLGNAGIGLPSC